MPRPRALRPQVGRHIHSTSCCGAYWWVIGFLGNLFVSNYLYKPLTLIRHCVVFFRFGAFGSSGSFEVGTSSKTSSLAAVTGGSFTLIVSVGSWQCEFKVGTFCRANSKILPSYAIWQKISMPYKLSGKKKFSVAPCRYHQKMQWYTALPQFDYCCGRWTWHVSISPAPNLKEFSLWYDSTISVAGQVAQIVLDRNNPLNRSTLNRETTV